MMSIHTRCDLQYSICGETRGGQQCIFDVFLTSGGQ